jgi:hypothetical protein
MHVTYSSDIGGLAGLAEQYFVGSVPLDPKLRQTGVLGAGLEEQVPCVKSVT